MEYKPGKHLIATLQPGKAEHINEYAGFNELINRLVTLHQLVKLGEVYHNFSPGGFTAVVCLSESHISIHTWPEHRLVNVDV
jgi:S-adenosylmethionine decarboxylase